MQSLELEEHSAANAAFLVVVIILLPREFSGKQHFMICQHSSVHKSSTTIRYLFCKTGKKMQRRNNLQQNQCDSEVWMMESPDFSKLSK
jgi:hypothetical protein